MSQDVCLNCQTPGKGDVKLKQCSGCVQVSYCSLQCQKANWKKHKSVCKPFKLIQIDGKGFGLVTTRAVKKAEVIMKENPTLVRHKDCPSLINQFNKHSKSAQKEILDLYHYNTTDPVDKRLEEIFKSNACDIKHGLGVGLYPTIPRMNHSCIPNVVWSYVSTSPLTKEVRSLRNIQPGEELCPNYIDSFQNTFSSSGDRKRLLLARWKFECKCEVCSLPNDQQQNNDDIRKQIGSLHESIPSLMSKWKVKEALEAAKKKLKLMMTVSEQMTTIIPSAILEVYEMNRLAQEMSLDVESNCSNLLNMARKLSKELGDSFVDTLVQKLQQIELECEAVRRQ